jgi:hypothetical protein
LVLVGLASCAGEPSPAPDAATGDLLPASGGPRVELGQGTSTFIPIEKEGAQLQLVQGPQGGWHVDVTCKFWGLDPDGMTLAYVANAAGGDGGTVSHPSSYVLTRDRVVPEGDAWVRTGDRVVFDIMSPSEILGNAVVISVLVAQSTSEATDQRRVTIVEP